MFEVLFARSRAKFAYYMTILSFTPHHILIGDKAFQSYGSTSVYAASTYSYFRPESVSESVRESGTRIDESTRRVHASAEY